MLYRLSMRAFLLLGLGIVAAGPEPARAALGGDQASVAVDVAELHGTVDSYVRQNYSVRDITAEAGMRVRQYLNRDGVVFAVYWSGPVLPNLQRLLGTHFEAYTAALASLNHPGLHRFVRLAMPGLVVESGGHLRAYAGRAYLPALIPAGVSAAELR